MPLLSDSPYKVGRWVQVRENVRDDWTKPYAGRFGKVVMVGLDIYNHWVFDLEIDGVKVTSFRTHHICNTLSTMMMS